MMEGADKAIAQLSGSELSESVTSNEARTMVKRDFGGGKSTPQLDTSF